MKRITPEQVREAFLFTGLTPKQGEFLFNDGCGCGLGAVYTKQRMEEANEQFKNKEATISEWKNGTIDERHICADLDAEYSSAYRTGFAQGFDGTPCDTENYHDDFRERYDQGYKDGQDAFEAVQDLIPPVTI